MDSPIEQMQRPAADLKLVADATRLAVLKILADGEKYVGEINDAFGISQPALSHHLALLKVARLIEARRDGKRNFYRATEAGIRFVRFAESLRG